MNATQPEANSRRLIIFTADDFGLTTAVNHAVEQAHVDGVLSTASLMVTGNAATDAVTRARRLPDLKVGLHLVLVEGAAVLPKALIPDLLNRRGMLPSRQVYLSVRYYLLPYVRQQLAREIRAQFEAFRSTGLTLDHANAHKHMHLHPTVARLMISIGIEYGLRAIRIPSEPTVLLTVVGVGRHVGSFLLHAWTRRLRRQVELAGLTVNDHVFGIALSGHMTTDRVIAALAKLPCGLTEMYFHPASEQDALLQNLMPKYEHRAELQCLVDMRLRLTIHNLGIETTTWAEQVSAKSSAIITHPAHTTH